MSLDTSLHESALWSDRFFNSDLTNQVYDTKQQKINKVELEAAAKEFNSSNADCPFDVEWLVKEFEGRL